MEVLHAIHNWREYFSTTRVSMSGLTIQIEGEDVSHSFRFVQRQDIHHYRMKGYLEDWSVDMVHGPQTLGLRSPPPGPAHPWHHCQLNV